MSINRYLLLGGKLFIVVFFVLAAWTTLVRAETTDRYVVHLESDVAAFKAGRLSDVALPEGTFLYATEFEKDGVLWHRLRLGFFNSSREAKQAMKKLIKRFPTAWVARVSAQERELAPGLMLSTGAAPAVTIPKIVKKATPAVVKESAKTPVVVAAKTDEKQLLLEADEAMTAANYPRAIQLYTKLGKAEDDAVRELARRKLGMAREANGQIAHAKAEYRRYLKLYPEGDGAKDVQTRLDQMRARQMRGMLLGKTQGIDATDAWFKDFYGSFSTFYYRNSRTLDKEDTEVTRSSLNPDFDFTVRLRNDTYDIRTVFIGGHEEDLLEDGDSETRISSAYVDLKHKAGHSIRLGRQSRSNGGVLGRFDGAYVGIQLFDKLGLNLVGGYPVQSSTDGFESDKHFYGLSFDLGTFADHWNFNTYFITQETEGIVDRRAVGGEVRFFHPIGNFFTLADYDISYDELNMLIASGTLTLPSGTIINVFGDYRQNPLLMTSNAVIGQIGASLEDLLDSLGEDAVRDLARESYRRQPHGDDQRHPAVDAAAAAGRRRHLVQHGRHRCFRRGPLPPRTAAMIIIIPCS